MKKIFLICLLLFIVGTIYYFFQLNVQSINPLRRSFSEARRFNDSKINPTLSTIKEKDKKITISQRSIFVPYWNIDDNLAFYDRYIYFGITANSQGVDKEEVGYLKLDEFVKTTEGKDTYLTLRLLDNDFNHELLKDSNLQQKIIEQTLEIAKEKKFKGVVLDLELFSLFNEKISGQINDFVQKFYTASKSNYKSFALTMYGDVFFRERPFDLSFLGKNSDEILVMAYDFSKSIGEPGPNFPLARQSDSDGGPEAQIYNYDFKLMTEDFLKFVPKEKLTIIYGMFGYDWTVDEKKRPINQAKALTLNEIKNKFFALPSESRSSQDGQAEFNCSLKNCVVKKDDLSKETEIDYTISSDKPDEQNFYRIDYHIVWFEDEESVKVKSQYLQEQGISRIGYWAWGYF